MDEQVIRDAFEQVMIEGGYQYSPSNKDNAYAWFRSGWIAKQVQPINQLIGQPFDRREFENLRYDLQGTV